MKKLLILIAMSLLLTMSAVAVDLNVEQGSSVAHTVTYDNSENYSIDYVLSLSQVSLSAETLSSAVSPASLTITNESSDTAIVTFTASAAQVVGTYTGNLTATLSDGNVSVTRFSVTVTDAVDDFSVPSSVSFTGNIIGDTVTKTILVTNDGSESVTLAVTTDISSTYNPQLNTSSLTVAAGDSTSILLTINVPSSASDSSANIGSVTFEGDTTHSTSVNLNPDDQGLFIKELNVKVDGKKDKDLAEGDTISKEAAPGDEIVVEIELENTFEDIDVRDVEVQLLIENIDDGDDIDEEADERDVDADDTEDFEITFKVPLLVEEDTYAIDIHIEARDEDDKLHEIDITVYLDVEKERHEVILDRARLSPTTLTCTRSATLEARAVNVGGDDEDVTISVENANLNLNIEKSFELEEGDDDDSAKTVNFQIRVDDNVRSGTYPVDVKVYRGSSLEDSETLDLRIGECNINSGSNDRSDNDRGSNDGGSLTVIGSSIGSTPTIGSTSSDSFTDGNMYLIVLAIIVVLLLIFVLLMIW